MAAWHLHARLFHHVHAFQYMFLPNLIHGQSVDVEDQPQAPMIIPSTECTNSG